MIAHPTGRLAALLAFDTYKILKYTEPVIENACGGV
jgi:hypothetical protein